MPVLGLGGAAGVEKFARFAFGDVEMAPLRQPEAEKTKLLECPRLPDERGWPKPGEGQDFDESLKDHLGALTKTSPRPANASLIGKRNSAESDGESLHARMLCWLIGRTYCLASEESK